LHSLKPENVTEHTPGSFDLQSAQNHLCQESYAKYVSKDLILQCPETWTGEFPHTQYGDKSWNTLVSVKKQQSIWLPEKATMLQCSSTDMESTLTETKKVLHATQEEFFIGS